MSVGKLLFTIHALVYSLFHISLLCETDAVLLEVLNVEKLCNDNAFKVNLDMRTYESFVLKAEMTEPMTCSLTLDTNSNHSVAMSISQYNLEKSENIVFKDSGGIQLFLTGSALYEREEKSFMFEGPVTIEYEKKITDSNKKVIFEFVFTNIYGLHGNCHAREFSCSNGKCIQSYLVCNDHNNCGDRSDERDCFLCGPYLFKCDNGMCIAGHIVCDAHNDCGDYSDEHECGRPCVSNEFTCYNLKCIPDYEVCDGMNNCGDRSDEAECNRRCFAEEFQCDIGKCIEGHLVCDGHNNCGDQSDEKICHRQCLKEEFQCSNKGCVHGSLVCDEINSCGDLSDEKDCFRPCCTEEFRCLNSRCLPYSKVCDGINDCGDRSDEKECNRTCNSNEFRCRNRKCIKNVLVCNDKNDCGDWSDEENCSSKEIEERKVTVLPLPIVISISVAILIVLIIIIVIIVVVYKKKKAKQSATNASSVLQQTSPSSFVGRMRQSFRGIRQPTAPPLQMSPVAETASNEFQKPPSLMDRFRQSFRTNRAATNTTNTNSATVSRPVNSETHSIYPHLPPTADKSVTVSGPQNMEMHPHIYPHLPSGVNNPEFKIEE